MSLNHESLRIIYKYKSIVECADVWIGLCNVLKEEGLLLEKYELVGKLKTVSQIEKNLSNGESLIINDHLFSFSFSAPWAGKLQQLVINKDKSVKVNWGLWIKKLSEFGIFVYAWKYDREYSFWQNNEEIESYRLNAKPYEHLPTKPSGVSLPFAQIVIDTGKNPGRNVFKTGYVEAVGSTMWLGDEFFPLTGSNKDTVKSADWLQVSELKPGILKIQAQENCFTQSEGKEADLQYKLRDLLYPGHD